MPARDIETQVKEWVADEASKQSFTDDIGWAATLSRVVLPQQNGVVYKTAHWDIALTIKTGLVGSQATVGNVVTCESPDPKESVVRDRVAGCIEQLRQYRTALKAQGNGRP